MFIRRRMFAVVLVTLGTLLAASGSYAGKPSGGTTGTSAPACVMTDFVGGAPYPAGLGPYTDVGYPNTGQTVTGQVYVQQASYSGIWVGDAMPGSITKIQLYVDGSLTATTDYTARKTASLIWNSTGGSHSLMLRMYSANMAGTKSCYVDSLLEWPLVL